MRKVRSPLHLAARWRLLLARPESVELRRQRLPVEVVRLPQLSLWLWVVVRARLPYSVGLVVLLAAAPARHQKRMVAPAAQPWLSAAIGVVAAAVRAVRAALVVLAPPEPHRHCLEAAARATTVAAVRVVRV